MSISPEQNASLEDRDEVIRRMLACLSCKTGIRPMEHQRRAFEDILSGMRAGAMKDETCFLCGSADADRLLEAVTVGESYFFRDPDQMRLLAGRLLPALIKMRQKAGDLSLRVLSAGCAAGQELYSVSMMLSEMLPHRGEWRLDLVGTDICRRRIDDAAAAVFRSWSLRVMPDELIDRYFHREAGDRFRVRAAYRASCRFQEDNLMDPAISHLQSAGRGFDIILCRNVLVYFSPSSVHAVTRRLGDMLIRGGYLILGAGDPDPGELPGLVRLCDVERGVYYQKADADPGGVGWEGRRHV